MAMRMSMISSLGVLIAAMAMGGASAGGSDCSAVVYEMMPCVDYISIGSTKGKASKGCCKAVGDAMKRGEAECMCVALKQSGGMGIQLNLTRALGLPVDCGISTPLPHCGIAIPTGTAPAPVPNAKAPMSLAPSRTAPTLAPTMPPTLAPVNQPAPAVPRRRMPPSSAPVPSNGPTSTPFRPDSPGTAPTPGQSYASSLTISSSLIVPVLFTLLVLF